MTPTPKEAAMEPQGEREAFDASKLAKRHAVATGKWHKEADNPPWTLGYLRDAVDSPSWRPHGWVVAAVQEAYTLGRASASASTPAQQAVGQFTDAQVIELCERAGVRWHAPDDIEEGFPGSFDMVSMQEMRALLNLAATPAQ